MSAPAAVYVPGGWLSAGGDPAALNALPPQRWWVRPFWIGRDPVTVSAYAAFLNALPTQEGAAHLPKGLSPWLPEAAAWVTWRGGAWEVAPDAAQRPVVGVSWWSAVAYCGWLAAADDTPWRLPMELEWERAARGDDGRAFPWGGDLAPGMCRMINDLSAYGPGPSPVDLFPQDLSPFGARGMGGNAADWCLDAYRYEGPASPDTSSDLSPDASSGAPDRAPIAPRLTRAQALSLPPDAPRVYRGGAWQYTADLCRAARRGLNAPDYCGVHLGFRVARDG